MPKFMPLYIAIVFLHLVQVWIQNKHRRIRSATYRSIASESKLIYGFLFTSSPIVDVGVGP